jgi:hypothetical protein
MKRTSKIVTSIMLWNGKEVGRWKWKGRREVSCKMNEKKVERRKESKL